MHAAGPIICSVCVRASSVVSSLRLEGIRSGVMILSHVTHWCRYNMIAVLCNVQSQSYKRTSRGRHRTPTFYVYFPLSLTRGGGSFEKMQPSQVGDTSLPDEGRERRDGGVW